ncbi:hypothetical protein CSPAE12_07657, partial [Colletotrichum incanum]
SDIVSLPCIAMYHCDITWNTPDPSEDQHKLEHEPQYQQHQRQQSREPDEAWPAEVDFASRDTCTLSKNFVIASPDRIVGITISPSPH